MGPQAKAPCGIFSFSQSDGKTCGQGFRADLIVGYQSIAELDS